MKTLYAHLLCAMTLVVTSCAQSPSPVSDAPDAPVAMQPTAHLMTPALLEGRKMTAAEKETIITATQEAGIRVRSTISSSANWREAQEGIQDFLDLGTSTPDYLREQLIGVLMLHMILESPDRDPTALAAIARYTGMLARHHSPEAELMVRALQALESYWTREQISEAAKGGVVGAEAFLAATYKRGSKKADPAVKQLAGETEDTYADRLEVALDHLKAMSLR